VADDSRFFSMADDGVRRSGASCSWWCGRGSPILSLSTAIMYLSAQTVRNRLHRRTSPHQTGQSSPI
jgi:hypothetical protein